MAAVLFFKMAAFVSGARASASNRENRPVKEMKSSKGAGAVSEDEISTVNVTLYWAFSRALFCLVTDDNEASKALCSRFGFEKVGCLKAAGVKFGRPLDLGYYELLL